METEESINNRYRERRNKYLSRGIYGAILGLAIATIGFAKNYYETGNIPGLYPYKISNTILIDTGIGLALASFSTPILLDVKERRKRKQELESLSETAQEIETGLPFSI